MTKNYFAVERDGKCIERIYITKEDGTIAFEEVMNMPYDELAHYKDIDTFVTAVMDVTNECFDEHDSETAITLVGADDVFVWSLLIGPGDTEDALKYVPINWQQDERRYRYAPEEAK